MRISEWSSDVCSSDLHPPPPPTRNSMNQPSSLLGVLTIGPAPCFSAGLGYYHPLKTRPAFFDLPQVDESETASRPIPVSLATFQPVFHSVTAGKEPSGTLRPESEDRRGGKVYVGRCRCRWSPYH